MNKDRYSIICEYAWGCVPVDTIWAIETNIFKETEQKLIEKGIIKKLIN